MIPDYGILTSKYIRELQDRWVGEEQRISLIIEHINEGKDWTNLLVENELHDFSTLQHVNDGSVKYIIGKSQPPDLRGIRLENVTIAKRTNLSKVAFDVSNLSNVNFSGVNLIGATFEKANLDFIIFHKTFLQYANFYRSKLENSEFIGTNLEGINFVDCHIYKSIFADVTANDVKFNVEPHLGFLHRFLGKRVGTRVREFDLKFDLNVFNRIDRSFYVYLLKEQYIDDLKSSSKMLYYLLYLISDFGRSLPRFVFWIMTTWIFFGNLYAGLPFRFGLDSIHFVNEIIELLDPKIIIETYSNNASRWIDGLYFSGVVMTTLGSSVISVNSIIGKLYVLVESVIGFIFLSAFVSTLILPGKRYWRYGIDKK